MEQHSSLPFYDRTDTMGARGRRISRSHIADVGLLLGDSMFEESGTLARRRTWGRSLLAISRVDHYILPARSHCTMCGYGATWYAGARTSS
jgi:hypothetical protein